MLNYILIFVILIIWNNIFFFNDIVSYGDLVNLFFEIFGVNFKERLMFYLYIGNFKILVFYKCLV